MKYPVLDGHCDTAVELWRKGESLAKNSGQVSLAQAAAFPAYVQFFAFCTVWIENEQTDEERFASAMAYFSEQLRKHSIPLCRTSADVSAILQNGGVGAALSIEGAEAFDCDPGRLEELAAQGVDVDLYAGFRDEPYRVDAFSAACRSVHIATDSGRHGHHGFVTDLLDPAKYTAVCTCGPEIMMEKVAKMCLRAGVRVYVSREAKMACGVGACLGCTCKSKNGGVSVCKDGPVFEGSVLYELD